jgi:hypothetical protein
MDHFCIEVPTKCSVGDVLKKAWERSDMNGESLWCSDVRLDLDHLFADYFEPEATYDVRPGLSYPEGSLLESNDAKLTAIGVTDPRRLMEMGELEWSMDEFLEKAGDFAPTLELTTLKNGTVCGGVAGVPWPKHGACGAATGRPRERWGGRRSGTPLPIRRGVCSSARLRGNHSLRRR